MEPNVKTQCDIIIDNNTLPPQIDYVSPSEKQKIYDANDFLSSLPKEEKEEAYAYIEQKTNAYYEPNEDGISIAYLDSLF